MSKKISTADMKKMMASLKRDKAKPKKRVPPKTTTDDLIVKGMKNLAFLLVSILNLFGTSFLLINMTRMTDLNILKKIHC